MKLMARGGKCRKGGTHVAWFKQGATCCSESLLLGFYAPKRH